MVVTKNHGEINLFLGIHNLVGGWTTHLKNMIVKMGIFPNFRGENKKSLPQIGVKIKNLWNHHLVTS